MTLKPAASPSKGSPSLAAQATAQGEPKRLLLRETVLAAELDAIMDSIPDGIYIGDAMGITRTNHIGLSQLGYVSPNDLDRSIVELMSEVRTRFAETGAPMTDDDQPFSRALKGERAVQDIIVQNVTTGRRSSCGARHPRSSSKARSSAPSRSTRTSR